MSSAKRNCEWDGTLDLLNIVLIGVSEGSRRGMGGMSCIACLGRCCLQNCPSKRNCAFLRRSMEREEEPPVLSEQEEEKEEVRVMCNLGEGIREKAEARGKAMGEAKVILGMYSKGYSLEQIADVSEKSIEEVRGIVEKRDTVLV